VVRVKGLEHALQLATDSAYGLSSAMFGRDVTRALGVAAIVSDRLVPVIHQVLL
jgi:acyl-CoA reductase-like NAD-dependent aldehyde dehydrogenase